MLTPQEAESLFETLRAMAAEGRTVIFISHKLHEVKAVADRVTVLRGGKTVATLDAAGTTPRSLAALMVGREVDVAGAERRPDELGPPVLELEDVWAVGDRGGDAVRGVTLDVRAGEIVAVAGVAGNGQRELAETVTGMRPRDARHDPRRRPDAARRRSARGDPGRRRARAGGPAAHRRRAEPQHRLERRAQVLPRRRSGRGRSCGSVRSANGRRS